MPSGNASRAGLRCGKRIVRRPAVAALICPLLVPLGAVITRVGRLFWLVYVAVVELLLTSVKLLILVPVIYFPASSGKLTASRLPRLTSFRFRALSLIAAVTL
jgi:hypothetical protein